MIYPKRYKIQIGLWAFILTCVIFFVTNAQSQEEDIYRYAKVAVVKAMDVLALDSGEKLKLIGVNYPCNYDQTRIYRYMVQTKMRYGEIEKECHKSDDFIRNLAQGKDVILEFDGRKMDAVGFLLAYVWVPVEDKMKISNGKLPDYYVTQFKEDKDGKIKECVLLNASVIKRGFAIPVLKYHNALYQNVLNAAYEDALVDKRFIF